MISQAEHETFKLGRISRVDKEKRFHGIPKKAYSCVVRAPYIPTDTEWAKADPPKAGALNPRKPVVDAVFYMAKADAWEESAFLNGKRPNETEEDTKARRNRSVMDGKVWTVVPLHSMGALGVGKTAADVENNTAGTTIGGSVVGQTVVEEQQMDSSPLVRLVS